MSEAGSDVSDLRFLGDMSTDRVRKKNIQRGHSSAGRTDWAGSGTMSCFWVNDNVDASNKA